MAPKAKTRTTRLSDEQRVAIVEKVENYMEQHGVNIQQACSALRIHKSAYHANRFRLRGYSARGKQVLHATGKPANNPQAGSLKAQAAPEVQHNGSDVAGITQEFPLAIIPGKAPKKAPQPKPINGSRGGDDEMTARQLLQVADRLSQVLAVAASLLVKR